VNHGHDEHFGARPLKRAIQRYIEDPLSEKLLMGEFSKGDEIEVAMSGTEKEKLEFRVLTPTPQADGDRRGLPRDFTADRAPQGFGRPCSLLYCGADLSVLPGGGHHLRPGGVQWAETVCSPARSGSHARVLCVAIVVAAGSSARGRSLPTRGLRAAALLVASLVAPAVLSAQEPAPDALAGRCATPDTIAVRGISRVTDAEVRAEGALRPGSASTSRASSAPSRRSSRSASSTTCRSCVISNRYRGAPSWRTSSKERALLGDVDVKGVEKLSARSAREKVTLLLGRPVDPADIASTRARIDSMYRGAGYYLASIRVDSTPLPDGRLGITFVVERRASSGDLGARVRWH
jgi:hypothetical protein